VPFGGHVVVRWIIYALTFFVDYDADEPLVSSRLLGYVMLTAEKILRISSVKTQLIVCEL